MTAIKILRELFELPITFASTPIRKEKIAYEGPRLAKGYNALEQPTDYRDAGLAEQMYQLYLDRGIEDVEWRHGGIDIREFSDENGEAIAYRLGNKMITSTEACKYRMSEDEKEEFRKFSASKNPKLALVAYLASKDHEFAYYTAHEAEERGGPKELDAQIHRQVHKDALRDLYQMGYEKAVVAGIRIGNQFPWGQLGYDTDERVFGHNVVYNGRATAQPQPSTIITPAGPWLNLLVDFERAAIEAWRIADTDPVWGPASFIGNEMKATGYGLSPITKLRPPGMTWTLGPRREPEFEQVSMQQNLPNGTLSRQWRQRRG